MICCCRKAIKDDLERSRRSSFKCVKTPAVSRISPGMPDITPVFGKLSLPSASPRAQDTTPLSGSLTLPAASMSGVKSRNSSTVKSRNSLPVCGDSFFEDSDADRSCSNWSFLQNGTEFSSFDVSNVALHDITSMPSSGNAVRSHEVSPAGLSMCSVQRSPMSALQCQTSTVTSHSVLRESSDTSLTSRRPLTTSVNHSPASYASQQKPLSTSSAAATTPACSPPSGLTDIIVLCIIN